MRYIQLFFLFFYFINNLQADIFDKIILNIDSIKNNKIIVKKANLEIGISGIIVHNYDKLHSSILDSVVVIDSNKTSSTLKISKFNQLVQKSIPNTNLKVSKKDLIILKPLYKNAMIISPNLSMLEFIKNQYKNRGVMFINSDQFGAYLAIEHIPSPKKKDFISFCHDKAIGLIFFVLRNKFVIVDASSFKIIKSYKHSHNIKSFELPFYTRVEDIEKTPFNFISSPIKDYIKYYNNLLNVK